MKNNIYIHFVNKLVGMFMLLTCLVLVTAPASADSRSEAKDAVMSLRQNNALQKLTDEIASIETTFSVAEQYTRQNHPEQAEQYYRLTIQKASILNKGAAANKSAAAVSASGSGNSTPSAAAQTQRSTVAAKPAEQQPPSPSSSGPQQTQPVATTVPPQMQSQAADDSEDEEDDFLSDRFTSSFLVGNPSTYTVGKHETIKLIAAKLGVTRQHLMELNGLNGKSVLKAGQRLKYNNRKIIPQLVKNGIIINIPEKTLYYFKGGKLTRSLPVALGVPTKTKKFDWKTPTGKFKIVAKQKNPTWYVPPSIQEEMEDEGKEVITSIPPGPNNPLGKYAFKTSLPGILIHSTIRPASIYSFASHGCIRVYPQHMEEFFHEVKVNTPGEIIYKPVKLASTEDGRIFLEVHHDAYGKGIEPSRQARQLIEKQQLADKVDWHKVKSVIRQRAGVAEDITL